MDAYISDEGVAQRELHIILLCDCSGSMTDKGKISTLNEAVRQAIPIMQDVARENPAGKMLVRCASFAHGAHWHIATPTEVQRLIWQDLAADGPTEMGQAYRLVAKALTVPPMPRSAYRPLLILISDGMPTSDTKADLAELMATPYGKRAFRTAIAIGNDADHGELRRFIGNSEIPVLQANNPEALREYIQYVTCVLSSVAMSGQADAASSMPQIPQAPEIEGPDVF